VEQDHLLNRAQGPDPHSVVEVFCLSLSSDIGLNKRISRLALRTTRSNIVVDERALRHLLDRALQGDQEACTDLIRHLEPVIRRAVRVHLPSHDPLRRLFDSMDITQSVLVQFLTRAGLGAIQLQAPAMLYRLLQHMAVQKFIDKKREAEALRRDHRSSISAEVTAGIADQTRTSPEEIVATRELYEDVRRRFTPRERRIAELWAAGYSFPEISQQVRGQDGNSAQPNAMRMVLHRALRRVARQLSPNEEIE
jgi:DNA-binding NarL/FixJ family response regulator